MAETQKAEAAKAAEAKPTEAKPTEPEVDEDALKEKAPSLTKEFVSKHKLDKGFLAKVARGEEPPPPTPAAEANDPSVTDGDLHLTEGGWQITPKGVKPEEVNEKSKAISR